MKMIVFIIFGVLTIAMSALYTVFHNQKGYKALLIRGGAVLTAFALALICANLNSLTNALPLLIFFGMGFLLLSESMITSPIEQEKPKMIVFGVLKALGIACFGLSALSLSYFNVFALGGGLLIGLGIGCVVCAVKKYKQWYQVLATLVIWVAIGFMIAEGIYAYLASSHMITSIIMAGAGVLFMLSQLFRSFVKDTSKMQYVVNLLYILGIAAVACSMYFY
ncbi:MAG: hypothetical protein J6A28_05000 [Clostridia bacterium]|nr:hypothetical protein [Clostridia bacterium]